MLKSEDRIEPWFGVAPATTAQAPAMDRLAADMAELATITRPRPATARRTPSRPAAALPGPPTAPRETRGGSAAGRPAGPRIDVHRDWEWTGVRPWTASRDGAILRDTMGRARRFKTAAAAFAAARRG